MTDKPKGSLENIDHHHRVHCAVQKQRTHCYFLDKRPLLYHSTLEKSPLFLSNVTYLTLRYVLLNDHACTIFREITTTLRTFVEKNYFPKNTSKHIIDIF